MGRGWYSVNTPWEESCFWPPSLAFSWAEWWQIEVKHWKATTALAFYSGAQILKVYKKLHVTADTWTGDAWLQITVWRKSLAGQSLERGHRGSHLRQLVAIMTRERGHSLAENHTYCHHLKLKYSFCSRIQDETAAIPQCVQGVAQLVRGAAAASHVNLFEFSLRCEGALRFPPLGPAILKPDLGHRFPSVNWNGGKCLSMLPVSDDGCPTMIRWGVTPTEAAITFLFSASG